MAKPPAQPAIDKALQLDGDPDKVRAYYAQWARSYDSDVAGDYVGIQTITQMLIDLLDTLQPPRDPSHTIVADVGCGTGLVGALLAQAGFTTIDGMDISPEMIDEARKLGVFRSLHAEVDINFPPPPSWRRAYDAAVCCGVFTLGHVQPTALHHLIEMIRPGGLVLTSTRLAYYQETDYQAVSDEVVASGSAKLIKCLKDAPYTEDSDAHYWAYQVT